MKQFLKFLLASVLGFFISLFILIFTFFIFSFALVSSLSTPETITVSDNSILELKFDYEVPERSNYQPISNFSVFPSMRRTIGINDIIRLIEYSKTDDKVKGIFIDLDNLFIGGLAKVSAIRDALIDFKLSGKFLIAHGNSISERAYFLATAADSIYLTSTGTMEFDGFGIEITFFKNLLEKLEIEPQVFQYGKYKSATEPFRLEKLSDENREQLNSFLTSVYRNFISKISESIKIEKDLLFEISNKLELYSAEDAADLNFVDELLYEDQVDSLMQNLAGSYKKPNRIRAEDYINSISSSSESTSNRIAVVYALGEIVNSRGDEYTIGTKNIINAINKAKKNSRVNAIVLRINSPGGSPLTSDMIWREIELASKEKPFVVSMGEVAASGGYYIACNADRIVTEEYSLVGSIGVYGIIPNTQKFFNNKLGITFDRVETSEYSNLFTVTKPLSSQQKKIIENQINDIYFDFVNRVADGRKMSFDEVDEIAQGRIWSGIDAVEVGLADTLGNLKTALSIAARLAGIDKYKVLEYPEQKEAFEKIVDLLYSEVETRLDYFIFDEPFGYLQKLNEGLKYTGIQTRLPFTYKIDY